jgi:hypothetical protein
MNDHFTAWQVVLQSQAIHPTWRAAEHGNYLLDTGHDLSAIGRKAGDVPGLDHDETPIECIARWLRENEDWPGGPVARASGDAPCSHGAMRCVACINEAVERAEAKFERWKADFTEAAHDAANDAGLCGAFDKFMESQGLRGRVRDYELQVRVVMDVTVTIEARDGDEAERQLGLYEIRNAVTELISIEGSEAVANHEVTEVNEASD